MPHSRARGLAAHSLALVLLLAASAAAAPARAEPGWAPPVEVGTWADGGYGTLVASGPGRATAAWPSTYTEDAELLVAEGGPDGVSTASFGRIDSDAYSLAGGPGGETMLVWSSQGLWYSDRGPTGSLSSPTLITSEWVQRPVTTYGAGGAALVAYPTWGDSGWELRVHFKGADDEGFGPPVRVPVGLEYPSEYSAALTSGGKAVFAITGWRQSLNRLLVVSGDANGFTEPQLLAQGPFSLESRVEADGYGHALVAWATGLGSETKPVMVTVYDEATGFGAPKRVGSAERYGGLHMAVGHTGRALLSFGVRIGPFSYVAQLVDGNIREGRFTDPVVIPYGGTPQVDVGNSGHALVVVGDKAAWSPAPGVWTDYRPVICSAPGPWNTAADVAMDEEGNASVLWVQPSPGGKRLLSQTSPTEAPDARACPPPVYPPYYNSYVPYWPVVYQPPSDLVEAISLAPGQYIDAAGRIPVQLSGVPDSRLTIEGYVRLGGVRSRLHLTRRFLRLRHAGSHTAVLQLRGPKARAVARRHRTAGRLRLTVAAKHPYYPANSKSRATLRLHAAPNGAR